MCATPTAAITPFAEALTGYLSHARTLNDLQLSRLAAGRCIVCNTPLPARRRPDMQTCPRSVRQCRNVKSNQYHDQLKQLRREYRAAAAGQVRLFPLDTALTLPTI